MSEQIKNGVTENTPLILNQGAEEALALRQAVQVAQDFKYWLDIQKPGILFHPGGGDVRDCDAFKRASLLLTELVAQLG